MKRSNCVLIFAAAAIACAQVRPETPVLKAGVSVQMAATTHAAATPEADYEDALVVAVTARGAVYLGTTRITPAELAGRLAGAAKAVFLKADARAAWSDVAAVAAALRQAGSQSTTLLTAQPATAEPGRPMKPMGLAVRLGPAPAGTPVLEVPAAVKASRAILVNAAGTTAYGAVVRAIDECRASGAEVFLVTPVSPSR